MARPQLYSVRDLLSTKMPGSLKVNDVVFSTEPLRVCCFEVKERRAILSRTKILDASSVKLSGDSPVVQSLPVTQIPSDSFRITDQGWLRGRDETRIGDVADILVDDSLDGVELTVKLKHQLVLPSDTRNLLPKDIRKEFMRSMGDAMSFTGDSYTLAPLPVSEIISIRTGELLYEVLIDVDAEDLSNSIFRALHSGKTENGLLRRLFDEQLRN
jgi:hypothetical protein